MSYGRHGIHAVAGLAMLAGLCGGRTLPRKSLRCRYSSFCGPIQPTTRQQRRAMMREAAKPLRKAPTA